MADNFQGVIFHGFHELASVCENVTPPNINTPDKIQRTTASVKIRSEPNQGHSQSVNIETTVKFERAARIFGPFFTTFRKRGREHAYIYRP